MRLGTPSPKILAKYQRILPASEFAALDSWASQFYQFQLDWLFDQGDAAICNKARQIGLSHTSSAVGVLWGAFHGELTTIISVGDRESVEVLDKAKRHAWVLQQLGSKMAAVGSKDNATELTFASGGRILALPSTGGRSFSGNVFLDEYAYQQHAGKVWDAAAAVTMLGHRLRVISTPNGVGNEFHGLWKKSRADDSGWNRHEIAIEKAQSDGYPVDIKKCWRLAKGDPRIFDQLFRCKFLDNELQYIPSDLIEKASTDDLATTEGAYFAGLDIGKTVDRTVLYVLRKVAGPLYVTVHVDSAKRTDDVALQNMVARAFERFELRRLCLDETGLGAFPAMTMRKKYGASKVEPVNFTLQVKEDLATALYTAFTKQQLRIPKTKLAGCDVPNVAEQIREDIASLRRIITTAGNVRYDAPHTDEGHADSAWALALALHAAMTAPSYARL
jgi:phage FluMu gp28-like protein